MAGAPTPEARLQAFSESFRARMEAAEEPPTGESCQALSFIIVSDPVWLELHARFDRGERGVCSGAKDGSNRPLMRLGCGRIAAVLCGREVCPANPFGEQRDALCEAQGGEPLAAASRLGRVWLQAMEAGRDGSLHWEHGAGGEYSGATVDGHFFSKAELQESTSGTTAVDCER